MSIYLTAHEFLLVVAFLCLVAKLIQMYRRKVQQRYSRAAVDRFEQQMNAALDKLYPERAPHYRATAEARSVEGEGK